MVIIKFVLRHFQIFDNAQIPPLTGQRYKIPITTLEDSCVILQELFEGACRVKIAHICQLVITLAVVNISLSPFGAV